MIGLIQVAAYPVNHFPARGAVRDMVHLATGRNPAGAGFVAAETLAFYGATLGIALLCSDLGGCGHALVLGGALRLRDTGADLHLSTSHAPPT